MKKLYFSLLAIITFIFANAQIVNIPDANLKAKLVGAIPSYTISSTQTPIYNPITYVWSVPSYQVIDTNGDGEIQVTEAQAIKFLDLKNGGISNLTGIEAFVNLEFLNCTNNLLINIDVSQNLLLRYFAFGSNQLSNNIDVSQNTNLITLLSNNNNLTNLNISQNILLQVLACSLNSISNIDISQNIALKNLNLYANQLNTLNISSNLNLLKLDCRYNLLSTLYLSQNLNLQTLSCANNQLTNLDLSQNINLTGLGCDFNPLYNLDVTHNINLIGLNCTNNQLTTLNLSQNSNLTSFDVAFNQLQSLFIKNNNSVSWSYTNFGNNPNLSYICADEADINYIQQFINQNGYSSTCNVNSYCSFNPGGSYYTIQGGNNIDLNNNGCDNNDAIYQNLRIAISFNNFVIGSLISNASGNYSIPLSAGTYTIAPQLENPTYFTVSPTTATVSFPTTASPFNQNFCIVPNGVHHDLETVIIPLNAARPGFDASYKIKYKNKGNQNETASISFNYNDSILDLVSTSVTPTSQNTGGLNWNLGTLNPFQTGEILVTLNLNSTTETPPINAGNVVDYVSTISSGNSDETPYDNTSTLNQNVVNSYDPNDKTCIEGNTLNPTIIGQYLHYMIRFENNGTAAAQNIVVKDIIDTTKFDIASLQMTDASHNCYTRINGNKVEFIFENINLDFNDATNDGYVVFKIKLISTLPTSSQITNTANIYFDYNFPITTNTATSTFQTLQNNSFDFDANFTIYPNPTKDNLTIKSKTAVEISSIAIYNILGQVVLTTINPNETIDVSSLKTGSYFIKISSDKGISTSKFVKE